MSIDNFNLLMYAWMVLAVIIFFISLKVTAPYGRYANPSWGIMIDNRLGWFVMEFTVLVVFWWFVFPVVRDASAPLKVMIGLFTLHYVNRSLIFPWRIRTHGKKMPVTIMFSAVAFNLVNGSALGYYFAHFSAYENSWFTHFQFVCGLTLFLFGMAVNWKADATLIGLRRVSGSGYQIPYGMLFENVSCPNHLGEIIEWLGYALLCSNLPAFAFFIWTSANLIPRAISHHNWYRKNFGDYPQGRKAVIPFLL